MAVERHLLINIALLNNELLNRSKFHEKEIYTNKYKIKYYYYNNIIK